MSWKDNLRPASFRGIPFFIDTSQFTGGRRVTLHEFPDRDKPYPEDLGKVGNTWKVEGHIIGDDYFTVKKQLIEAAQKYGPGELIHPYYGTLFVQCGAFSIDEDNREGGIAKISFQFYEGGDNNFPKEVDDKVSIVEEKAEASKAASKDAFDNSFSVAKLPGFAVDTARASVAKLATTFEDATKGIKTNVEAMADLAYGIRNLRAETNALLQSPGLLSQRISDTFDLLAGAIDVPRDRLKALGFFYGFGNSDVAVRGNTPTRDRERDNKESFDLFIQQIAVASSAQFAASAEYESVEEATNTRNELRDLIDDILYSTNDDTVFSSYKDLNAQLVRAVPDVDSALPSVQRFIQKNTQPSLVVAYEFFDNVNLEEDLVERNSIRHPGFVIGGTEIEVLSDE